MAPANAVVKSRYFHPQHLLKTYHYSEASTYSCDACERIVTGTGYSCDECDFNIHEACFSLPGSISFPGHSEHELTLTRLTASRWCDVCRVTSHAGAYLYRCVPCNFDVHPRCTELLGVDQPQQRRQGRRSGVVRALKVGLFGLRLVDLATGGSLLSSAIDAVESAVDNM